MVTAAVSLRSFFIFVCSALRDCFTFVNVPRECSWISLADEGQYATKLIRAG